MHHSRDPERGRPHPRPPPRWRHPRVQSRAPVPAAPPPEAVHAMDRAAGRRGGPGMDLPDRPHVHGHPPTPTPRRASLTDEARPRNRIPTPPRPACDSSPTTGRRTCLRARHPTSRPGEARRRTTAPARGAEGAGPTYAFAPVSASVPPSPIIITPPAPESAAMRFGERANHSRAVPAASAHALSHRRARTSNSSPSNSS